MMREHDIKADPSIPENVPDAEHNEDGQTLEKLQTETTRLAEELEPYFPLIPTVSETEGVVSLRHILPIALQTIEIETAKSGTPNLRSIAEVVAERFELNYEDLVSKSRKQALILPRQIAAYLMYDMTHESYPTVANAINRDHTTVMHAFKKIQKLTADSAGMALKVESLKEDILRIHRALNPVECMVVVTRNSLLICQPSTLDSRQRNLLGIESEHCLNWDTRESGIEVWQHHGRNAISALRGLMTKVNNTTDLYSGL